jgi:hypothetical protein
MARNEKIGQTIQFAGVTLGYLDPVTLRPNPLNYQTHPEDQRQALGECIEEFGWVGFPIFNTRSGRLVDGHARVEEARKRKEAGVICVMVDLTEEAEKRLLLSYDRIGRLAQTDDNLLARLIRDCGDDLPPGWSPDDAGDVLLRIAEADAPTPRETPTPRQRGGEGHQRGDGEEAVHQSVASDVETIQLFFPADRVRTFREMVEFLKGDLGFPTASDTVFEVLRDAYEGR